jgi:chromosome segregation ATPase
MSRIEEPIESSLHRQTVADDRQQLMLEVARLQGELAALREQRAALEVATEHHWTEVEAARAEAADARAAQRADQARAEELRRTVADLRVRLEQAEEARRRAESERAAVIAVLGRKARRLLGDLPTLEGGSSLIGG